MVDGQEEEGASRTEFWFGFADVTCTLLVEAPGITGHIHTGTHEKLPQGLSSGMTLSASRVVYLFRLMRALRTDVDVLNQGDHSNPVVRALRRKV